MWHEGAILGRGSDDPVLLGEIEGKDKGGELERGKRSDNAKFKISATLRRAPVRSNETYM